MDRSSAAGSPAVFPIHRVRFPMNRNELIPTYPVYSIHGERHTLLLTGEQTGGAYLISEALVLPGGGPPYHLHLYQDEALIVLRGEFEFTVNGKKVHVSADGTLAVRAACRTS